MDQIIYRFHKFILVFCVFLTLVAILLVTRLKLDTNLLSLLPSGNPGVNAFFDVTEKIGFQSILIALVEMPKNINRKDAEAVVEHLVDTFYKSQFINEIEYKTGTRELYDIFQAVIEYFPQILKSSDLKKLAQNFSDDGIHLQVLKNKKLLMTPFGFAEKELVYVDPLGLRDLLRYSLTVPIGKQTIKPHSGYYRTKDGNYILFIKPTKPPQDVTFSKKIMSEVYSLEKIALSDLAERQKDSGKDIKISYTGGYPIAVDDEATTKRDIKVTLLTSFLGVMILFGLSFRTLKIFLLVGLSLAISLLWTLGFASLAFERLNVLTCIFSGVLIGLGIDFAIHIINRFFAQEKVNLALPQRLKDTFRESGMGIFIGGITTAAAFSSLGISDFKGFSELGILTGIGILICLAVMLFFLPSLMVNFANEKSPKKTVMIAGFGLKTLLDKILKYPRTVLMLTAVIILLLTVSGSRIEFDDNLKNFRTVDNKVLLLQDKITGWFGGSTSAILLITEGKTKEDVMEISARIFSALKELKRPGMIAGIRSVSDYLLPPSQQRDNMEFIRQHPDIFSIKRIKKTFNEALIKNGFKTLNLYDEYFESLFKAVSEDKILLPSTLKGTELERFFKLFVVQKGNSYRTVTYINPYKDLLTLSDINSFKKMIASKLEEKGIKRNRYLLTGTNLLTGELKELIIKNLKSSLWLASLGILVVLVVYYRNLKLVLLSILPLMIGLASLMGIMAIFHLNFNFINLIVIPMIVGIGIDDGVHLTNTYRKYHQFNMLKGMVETSRAVVLTSFTTLVGFGSIALSHYPGLKSMGYVAIIGISACLLTSVIVMPAIFSILGNQK